MTTDNLPFGIRIPDGVRFADLQLARDADGAVSFDWTPIELICAASGIDPSLFRDSAEDNLAALLTAWYTIAREKGEPPDPVEEDLIAEVAAQDALGDGLSHPPGSVRAKASSSGIWRFWKALAPAYSW